MTSGSTISALLCIAAATTAFSAEGIPVAAQRLGDLLVAKEQRAPASVVPANESVMTSQVAAVIDRVLKDVGDDVAKGELLVRLDDDNARYAVSQASAELAAIEARIVEAKLRVRNAQGLLKKNFISDEELIARQATLAALEANRQGQVAAVSAAELELARTRIMAPYDAAIVARQAQVGSYAQPGTPLVTLVQTDGREVDAELDPRHVDRLADVRDMRFLSQGREWPVRLLRISSVIEPSARIVRGRFAFVDGDAPIGASGQLVWNDSAGVLPAELIVQRGNQFGVFLAWSDTAKFVAIPGAQPGRPTSLDMPADTVLITRGHTRLQDGDPLTVSLE